MNKDDRAEHKASEIEEWLEEHGEGFVKFCVEYVTNAAVERYGGFQYPPDPNKTQYNWLYRYITEAIKKGPRYIDGEYLVDTFDNSRIKLTEVDPDTGGENENWWSPSRSEPENNTQ
jgi:hypothetical protein